LIRAFPTNATVYRGAQLELRVSGDGRTFTPAFYRAGARNERRAEYAGDAYALQHVGAGQCGTPWDWPAHRFAIPRLWKSGAYIAVLKEDGRDGAVRCDRTGRTLDARSGRALLVVRAVEPQAPLLVVLPLFTYQAYNVAHVDGTAGRGEGACLYSGAGWVTLLRPGGGIGAHPWDEVNADVYDAATPRQTFAHWDAKALAWLENNGYSYDVCTDLDLHEGLPIERYRVVTSFGHHEYWTPQMRERVERFLERGGNVAFFGGNTMWFRAEFDRKRFAIRRDGRWNDEWRTTGVTYARGGGRWIGERPATPYRAMNPSHPFFDGVQLHHGATFGGEARLVGYECDGTPEDSDLEMLGLASLEQWPAGDGKGERPPDGCAALGVRRHGNGRVFTASTTDWARVMASGDAAVSRISRNVFDAFGAREAVRMSSSAGSQRCSPRP